MSPTDDRIHALYLRLWQENQVLLNLLSEGRSLREATLALGRSERAARHGNDPRRATQPPE